MSNHADAEQVAGDSKSGVAGVVEGPEGTKYLEPTRARAFLGLVRAGDTLERTLDASLQREHDLSLHSFEVLLFLAVFAPDRQMSMSELRRQTPLSQSRVSRLVAQLEDDELVTRSTDPVDERAVNVRITDHGVATFKAAQDHHLQDLEHHLFSKLTEREVNQLAAITAKILDTPPR